VTNPGLTEVLMSLILVGLALGVSRWWKISTAKDMSIGSVRAFIQLVAVGYALEFIFGMESPWLIYLALLIMIAVGSHAAYGRVKSVSNSFFITFISIVSGSFITLLLMLLLDIISFEARYIIPLGGMIIGNSMNSSALTIERLSSDLKNNHLAIETSLSLGRGWRSASREYQKKAATAGMISILNTMKTIGLVALPGAMTGMILAGANPLKAVYLQIIVVYMILSAVTITSVVSMELTIRKFFSKHQQLISKN